MTNVHTKYLQTTKLRDTQARRVVLQILHESKTPLTYKDVYNAVVQKGVAINLTTVYRILQTFAELHIVHTHLHSGGIVLCNAPNAKGHHVLLSCKICGVTQECLDSSLCKQESAIAAQYGFTGIEHKSELVGVCSLCS